MLCLADFHLRLDLRIGNGAETLPLLVRSLRMHLSADELFLRVTHLSGDDVAWDRVCGDFREYPQVGHISASRGLALCSLALALSTQGDRRSGEPLAEEALAMARRSGDEPAIRMCVRALVEYARSDGRHETALRFTQQLRELGDGEALAEEIELLGLVDRPQLAMQLLDDAGDRLQRCGPEWLKSGLAIAELRHHQWFNSLDEAQSVAQAVARESTSFFGHAHTIEAQIALTRIAQLRGDDALARSRFAAAAGRFDRRTAEQSARLMLLQASLAWCEGEVGEALPLFRAAAEESRRTARLQHWQPSSIVEGTRCAVAAKQSSTAEHIIGFAQMLRDGAPASMTYSAIAAQTRALLSGDIELFREAARLARQSPRRLVRAEALTDYGRALMSQGRVLEAIAPLDDAWDLFTNVGARGSAIAVQRLLARAGVRRRKWSTGARRPLEGWGALTDAERRVARLIGAGHSNRSAAAKLGSTTNTVSSQVRSIFGKLGITSRVHLARMVTNEA